MRSKLLKSCLLVTTLSFSFPSISGTLLDCAKALYGNELVHDGNENYYWAGSTIGFSHFLVANTKGIAGYSIGPLSSMKYVPSGVYKASFHTEILDGVYYGIAVEKDIVINGNKVTVIKPVSLEKSERSSLYEFIYNNSLTSTLLESEKKTAPKCWGIADCNGPEKFMDYMFRSNLTAITSIKNHQFRKTEDLFRISRMNIDYKLNQIFEAEYSKIISPKESEIKKAPYLAKKRILDEKLKALHDRQIYKLEIPFLSDKVVKKTEKILKACEDVANMKSGEIEGFKRAAYGSLNDKHFDSSAEFFEEMEKRNVDISEYAEEEILITL